MAKRLFVAATAQNDGKTTVSVGLISALKRSFGEIGFIKPVGQRYVEADGLKIDEDSILVNSVYHPSTKLEDMSPVAVERGFTKRCIEGGKSDRLAAHIRTAFDHVAADTNVVIVEGTGHAGVGSVFGLSNATVAGMLRAPVVLVTKGGIGRPIDEIALNRCLFEASNVEVIGVVLNQVLPEKLESVSKYVRMWLERNGIRFLGAIPYLPMLRGPTLRLVLEATNGELLNGEAFLENLIDRTVVGAMSPHNALDYFGPRTLLITPGERDDLILTAMSSCVMGEGSAECVSGILLTGGTRPHRNIVNLIQRTTIPVILVKEDSYEAAKTVYNITVKIRPEDRKKISAARRLVKQHVDVEGIAELLANQEA